MEFNQPNQASQFPPSAQGLVQPPRAPSHGQRLAELLQRVATLENQMAEVISHLKSLAESVGEQP